MSNGEELFATVLSGLTGAMSDLSIDGVSFEGGPIGKVQGLLDKFDINFDDLVGKFMDIYNTFKSDLDIRSSSLPDFDLRPISLPRFPHILQIGSKKPSIQYSLKMNTFLWDKLAATFPKPTFNGVKIPNVPSGLTFADSFLRGDFPGQCTSGFT